MIERRSDFSLDLSKRFGLQILVKIRALNGGGYVSLANAEISESFAIFPRLGVMMEDRGKQRLDVRSGDILSIEFRQALASE
ncbi:MAG: hypothetical protein WEB53_08150, partial [Akkermansiaceae bacterium]